MKEKFKVGEVVVSTQGYDKSEIYVILSMENNFAILVNGFKKGVENPKRKNLKHIKLLNLFFDLSKTTPKNINQEIHKFIKNLEKNEKSL